MHNLHRSELTHLNHRILCIAIFELQMHRLSQMGICHTVTSAYGRRWDELDNVT